VTAGRKLVVVALSCAALLSMGVPALAAPAAPAAPSIGTASTPDAGDEDTSTDTSPDTTPISPGTLAAAPDIAARMDRGAAASTQTDPPAQSPQVVGGPPCTANPKGRPYFYTADWLWNPIPANPVLDPQSATFTSELAGDQHIADLKAYGVTLRTVGVNNTVPRYDVTFKHTDPSKPGYWGPDPFGTETAPIPNNTPLPTGGDKAVAIQDKSRCLTYNFLHLTPTATSWKAEFGALARIDGDGRETDGGSSTGSDIARFAAVVRANEIQRGEIKHAMFFSTNMAAAGGFRFPAAKTDGVNMAGVATPLPEGARVQLDPSIDLAAIPGITPFELTVGRALQRYGAYCGDNGGARVALIFEYVPKLKPYKAAGADGDYYGMPHIPWGSLRVLRSSDGT
jgi:hypothetical protein